MSDEKVVYLFLDTETTGLNFEEDNVTPRENQMLQVAYVLMNHDITEELDKNNFYVYLNRNELEKALESMDDCVTNMHTHTGLIDILWEDGKTTECSDIDQQIYEVLLKYHNDGYKITLAGNNVQFDFEVIRRHLPKTTSLIHYSFLDVSAIRKAFYVFGSDYSKKVKAEKLSNHNALTDIQECVKEFKKFQKILELGLDAMYNEENKESENAKNDSIIY